MRENGKKDRLSLFLLLGSIVVAIVGLMITKGQKVNEISEQLNLSPKTVNSYRYRMFSKLNIHGDVELTHLAIRHGLYNAETLSSQ